jgi:hypothetical protein
MSLFDCLIYSKGLFGLEQKLEFSPAIPSLELSFDYNATVKKRGGAAGRGRVC